MHPDLLELFELLRADNVQFLLVGATALAINAGPRYTEDVDLWIRRSSENTHLLANALREFAFKVSDEMLRPYWGARLSSQAPHPDDFVASSPLRLFVQREAGFGTFGFLTSIKEDQGSDHQADAADGDQGADRLLDKLSCRWLYNR